MSTLQIDSDIGKELAWAAGETYTLEVTATVSAMGKDGSYTLDVTDVQETESPEEEIAPEEEIETEELAPPGGYGKAQSAVMSMLGKGK